ncbi:hypothetical protein H0H87_002989 [Tephrocybe sp. NHM501043]|nr:hypothetical protein H0H87_002989 [Tephrocybe sp. NHM501043]
MRLSLSFSRIISTFALASICCSATPLAFSKLETRGGRTVFPFDAGFPIQKVLDTALNISTHSWEFGTAIQALLELYNPELSIYGDAPFTAAKKLGNTSVIPRGLGYTADKVVFGIGANTLADGDGAVGDPASLAVGAYLLGKIEGYEQYAAAAVETFGYVTGSAPRATNGAISHRALYVEIWADFVYMAPPFLAYYGADTANITALQEAVFQCQAYRDILHFNATSTTTQFTGLWEHILGPYYNGDEGLWSTGNAWAAAGMTRILATVIKTPTFWENDAEAADITQWRIAAIDTLTTLIKEIIDAVVDADEGSYDNGLVRNYFNKPTIFGETSGSSLFAATVYRLVALLPNVFGRSGAGNKYINWAEGIRSTLGGTFVDVNGTTWQHVDANNGTVRPSVNPLGWGDLNPWMAGSPEGQSFVVMLYAAWRDCRLSKHC